MQKAKHNLSLKKSSSKSKKVNLFDLKANEGGENLRMFDAHTYRKISSINRKRARLKITGFKVLYALIV